jgi:hypothetical protein
MQPSSESDYHEDVRDLIELVRSLKSTSPEDTIDAILGVIPGSIGIIIGYEDILMEKKRELLSVKREIGLASALDKSGLSLRVDAWIEKIRGITGVSTSPGSTGHGKETTKKFSKSTTARKMNHRKSRVRNESSQQATRNTIEEGEENDESAGVEESKGGDGVTDQSEFAHGPASTPELVIVQIGTFCLCKEMSGMIYIQDIENDSGRINLGDRNCARKILTRALFASRILSDEKVLEKSKKKEFYPSSTQIRVSLSGIPTDLLDDGGSKDPFIRAVCEEKEEILEVSKLMLTSRYRLSNPNDLSLEKTDAVRAVLSALKTSKLDESTHFRDGGSYLGSASVDNTLITGMRRLSFVPLDQPSK